MVLIFQCTYLLINSNKRNWSSPLRECLNEYGLNGRYDLVGKMYNKSLIEVRDKNDSKTYKK